MPYLHIGQSVTVEEKRIIGIFDLDNTTYSKHTRNFLDGAETEGQVISVCEDIPRSCLCLLKNASRSAAAVLRQRAVDAPKYVLFADEREYPAALHGSACL